LILLPPPPCWDCRHALLHAALHLFFFGNTGAHLLGRHSTAWPRLHPFYSGCFGDGSRFLSRPAWTMILQYFASCLLLGWQACITTPSFFHWDGILLTFLPRLA
jgi:hypothetical protein